MKRGYLSSASLNLYEDAKQQDIITDQEYDLLKEAQAAVRNAIKVDEFSYTGWEIQTPKGGDELNKNNEQSVARMKQSGIRG
jgi:endonuclease YncB( thermonuclease family)